MKWLPMCTATTKASAWPSWYGNSLGCGQPITTEPGYYLLVRALHVGTEGCCDVFTARSGLVAGNPAEAPVQTYSWWVTNELTVHGFVDYPNSLKGNDFGDAAWRRAHFAGVPAPVFKLALDGTRAEVAA